MQTTAFESRSRATAQGHLADALDNPATPSRLSLSIPSFRSPHHAHAPPISSARSMRLVPLTPRVPALTPPIDLRAPPPPLRARSVPRPRLSARSYSAPPPPVSSLPLPSSSNTRTPSLPRPVLPPLRPTTTVPPPPSPYIHSSPPLFRRDSPYCPGRHEPRMRTGESRWNARPGRVNTTSRSALDSAIRCEGDCVVTRRRADADDAGAAAGSLSLGWRCGRRAWYYGIMFYWGSRIGARS
ncbi:hypothetical protein DFH09DRAFT_1082517 [Mycena vulgaris]|nr:hypothetical protein DFH09DRAFT_1082517 [Mycena vulgaris]